MGDLRHPPNLQTPMQQIFSAPRASLYVTVSEVVDIILPILQLGSP